MAAAGAIRRPFFWLKPVARRGTHRACSHALNTPTITKQVAATVAADVVLERLQIEVLIPSAKDQPEQVSLGPLAEQLSRQAGVAELTAQTEQQPG